MRANRPCPPKCGAFFFPISVTNSSELAEVEPNVIFKPEGEGSESKLRFFIRDASGKVTLETNTSTLLPIGHYKLLATSMTSKDGLVGETEFEVLSSDRVQTVSILVQRGTTIYVSLAHADEAPRAIRLTPLNDDGSAWDFATGKGLFISMVENGEATFYGVPPGRRFQLSRLMSRDRKIDGEWVAHDGQEIRLEK